MNETNELYEVVGEGHEPITASKEVILREAQELADYYTKAEGRDEAFAVTEQGNSIYIGDQEFACKV